MKFNPIRYYVFDCYGKLVGNPDGYKTHAIADSHINRRQSLHYLVWRTFNRMKRENPNAMQVVSIKLGSVL